MAYRAQALACDGYLAGPNIEGNVEEHKVEFGAVAYICPKCDRTHFHISIPGMPYVVQLDLLPQEAEYLGQQLVNPPPLSAITKDPV